MPDFTGSKIQNPRCRQRQRGFKTKKGTNATANPSYVSEKISLSHLLYIVYQSFKRPQIFVGFFHWRLAADDIRNLMQHSAADTIFVTRHLEACIPSAVFRNSSHPYTSKQNLTSVTAPSPGLTGQHSPACLIFFTEQISASLL